MVEDTHTRLALVERELSENRDRLNRGAETFSDLKTSISKAAVRALLAVLGTVLSVAVSVGGVLYAIGKETAQREFTSEQAQRTEKLLTETREEVRLLQTKIEVSDSLLRAEADRRSALEDTVRALSARRRP